MHHEGFKLLMVSVFISVQYCHLKICTQYTPAIWQWLKRQRGMEAGFCSSPCLFHPPHPLCSRYEAVKFGGEANNDVNKGSSRLDKSPRTLPYIMSTYLKKKKGGCPR